MASVAGFVTLCMCKQSIPVRAANGDKRCVVCGNWARADQAAALKAMQDEWFSAIKAEPPRHYPFVDIDYSTPGDIAVFSLGTHRSRPWGNAS